MMFLPNTTEQETKDFLIAVDQQWHQERPSIFEFAIVLDGLQIGAVSISREENADQGEIGWILNRKYWNCGYASEAAMAVLYFAKNHLCLKQVIAHCDWRNVASARVMEKLGMRIIDQNGTRTYLKRNETARELTYLIEF